MKIPLLSIFPLLKKELELIKKEKEGPDSKLTDFQTALKDLDSLLESQRLDKNKEGLGYSAVPPPPAQIYFPPKKDMSWASLLEFADDTVTNYSRTAPTVESSLDDAQNRNPSVTVTEASPCTISPKPFIKFVKAADCTEVKTNKVETVKKSSVRYAKMYRRTSKSTNRVQMLERELKARTLIQKIDRGRSRTSLVVPWHLLSSALLQAVEEDKEIEVPTASAPQSPTHAPSLPARQNPTLTPYASPPHDQPNDMDADLQGRIYQDVSAATKDVSAAEPTVFDDEEVTMTMAQTLIKMKAEKVKLLDEQLAQKLHDEEIEKAAAREKQEKYDLERAKVLQQQKYQSLKKKPVSIAQARKNMIIYLKNMVVYKMEHFRDVEEPKKKRVAEETLFQESFKKLKAIKVLVSEFKVEALHVKYLIIDWEIHSEGSRSY
nr:hypothetical protein [Tanacetum cinerariifolium]